MSTQSGGKAVYGAPLGILMLEARFPRIPGDIGNAGTWPYPVQYRVVRGASPDRIVRGEPRDMTDAFIQAAEDLVRHGCDGITTNCGFLSLLQPHIAKAVAVPVITSSLLQVPLVQRMLPTNRRVGILTISQKTLTSEHLLAAGIDDPASVAIEGTDGGRAFTRTILDDHPTLDVNACRQDLLDATESLLSTHADIGAIVLECTNMTPYAADIRRASGLPVFSIFTCLGWFQNALLPTRFTESLDDPDPRRIGIHP